MTELSTIPAFHGAIATMPLRTLASVSSILLRNWLGSIERVSTFKIIPGEILPVSDSDFAPIGDAPACIGVVCDLFVRERGDHNLPPVVRSLRIIVTGVAEGGLGNIYEIDVHAPALASAEDVSFDEAPVISVGQQQLDAINGALETKGVVEHEIQYGPQSALLIYLPGRSPVTTLRNVVDAIRKNGLRHVSTRLVPSMRYMESDRVAIEFTVSDAPQITGMDMWGSHDTHIKPAMLRKLGWRVA